VMHDANYDKVIKILKRLVDGELRCKLQAELTDAAVKISRHAAEPGEDVEEIRVSLSNKWKPRLPFFQWLLSGNSSRFRQQRNWAVFPALSGEPVSLLRVLENIRETGVLYYDARPNRITDALQKQGIPVLVSGPWISAVETACRGHLKTAQASTRY